MIEELKPYPKYKDSGVPWLGDVPEHWEVKRLGSLLQERHETNANGNVTEVLSVLRNIGVIPYSEKGNIGNKKSEDITRYKIVRPDDIVVNCMNVIIGSVGLSKYTGCLSPVYYVLTRRSSLDNPRYLNAYFQNVPFQRSLVRIGKGILSHRMRIPMELLKCEPILRPTAEEQHAIATFLDYADRRIRRYIKNKQKLIKLLEEQKQVVINEAVTRGLNPDVPLKPSGVEWLGDIPEHWEVKKIKQISTPIEQGWSPQCYAWPAAENEWGVLKVGCVNGEFFNPCENKKLPPSLSPALNLSIHNNDILVSRANTKDLVGLAALVDKDYPRTLLCDKLFRFKALLKRADPQFLVYSIRNKTSRVQIESRTNGASDSMQNIGQGVIRNLLVAFPPLNEQKVIANFISDKIQKIGYLISDAKQEISLLREYRTRLIADVVTGKLDVREAVPNLPVDTEDSDLLDSDDLEDETQSEDYIDSDESVDDEAA